MAYRRNAERMKLKHSKRSKTHKFEVGEFASLRIPRIDRSSTDLQRLPCVIVQVLGKAQTMYRLRCKYGVLQTCFHAGDLEQFKGTHRIPVNGWEQQARVTVREAARHASPWNSFTKNRCNCKPGTCDTRKCHCKKTGIECSTHCHKGERCENKLCDTRGENPEDRVIGATTAVHDVSGDYDSKTTFCTCRTRCHSRKKCPCKAAKNTCTVLCHPQHTCVNVPITQTPVTVSIVERDDDTHSTNTKDWTICGSVPLKTEHKETLQSTAWLDDSLIRAAQFLLKEQFPHVGGLQSPLLGDKLAMEPQAGEFVQILCIRKTHWICVSTVGCEPSSINVYDSMQGRLDTHTRKLVADILQSKQQHIDIRYHDVQWQSSKMATGVKDDSEGVFVTYLDTTFPPDGKRTRSAIVRRSFAQQIVSHLKGQENPDKAFRHFVKKGQFRLLDLPAVGIRDALVVQVKQEKKVML